MPGRNLLPALKLLMASIWEAT